MKLLDRVRQVARREADAVEQLLIQQMNFVPRRYRLDRAHRLPLADLRTCPHRPFVSANDHKMLFPKAAA